MREWCINSAAIDVANKAAIVNSEDGHLYRWDFTTNKLSPGLTLEQGTGEPYTPTVIGPDGAVYAINRSVLHCCVGTFSGGPVITPLPPGPGRPIRRPIGVPTPIRPGTPLPRVSPSAPARGLDRHSEGSAPK